MTEPNRTYLHQFGRQLKLLSVKAGLTQEELAEAAGMHRTFIGLLERGEFGVQVPHVLACPIIGSFPRPPQLHTALPQCLVHRTGVHLELGPELCQ